MRIDFSGLILPTNKTATHKYFYKLLKLVFYLSARCDVEKALGNKLQSTADPIPMRSVQTERLSILSITNLNYI